MRQRNANDINERRIDFPILRTANRGKPLVYLDSAATTQKPEAVIAAINHFYQKENANIHRGVYELSERLSVKHEAVREQLKDFINARSQSEIVFVKGATEGINLVAQAFGRPFWQAGDQVIISEMEHHANIIPWHLLREQIGIELKVVPINEAGELDLDVYAKLFNVRTKLVALTHVSNVLGTVNPIKTCTAMAHEYDVPILIDGAQAAAHLPLDMQDVDCDFYVFSSHKMYGPLGMGVLYGKEKWLQMMPPYHGGGGMIETVSFDNVTYQSGPYKFEAGTQNMAGAIGLQAAMHYLLAIGFANIMQHEQTLTTYAQTQLAKVSGLRMIGTAPNKQGIFSFVLDGIHPHDVGSVLDHEGVAVRVGHHCAMPLMQRFQVPATVRASMGIYNTLADIDALAVGLEQARRLFG